MAESPRQEPRAAKVAVGTVPPRSASPHSAVTWPSRRPRGSPGACRTGARPGQAPCRVVAPTHRVGADPIRRRTVPAFDTTLLLDEPTNHLDADPSSGCGSAEPRRRPGDQPRDAELLADVVNRVWFLDAVRGEADIQGLETLFDACATDEQRRT